MSISLSSIPPAKLKNLREGRGPTVVIQWKRTPASEPEILNSFFPRAVATTFSPNWAQLFPAINKVSVADLHKANPTILTLVGGHKAFHNLNLNWMLSCCEGRGLQNWQRISYDDRPFSRYFFLKESATIIGCTHLEKMFGQRMDGIAAKQIHSEDVRTLFVSLPEGHEMLSFLAQHVAQLFWSGELKSKGAYITLREEIPAFNEAINAILNPLVEQRRAAKKAERNEYYAKMREEHNLKDRKEEPGAQMDNREQAKSSSKVMDDKQASTPEDTKTTETPAVPAKKLFVPGADDVATIPHFKMNNKAARRRQKRREAKATEQASAAAD